MTDNFDGYRKWLGISNKKRPPTHYELLSISLDEDDPEVIHAAAEQRRHFVESKRGDGHDAIVTEILYRINEAETILLNNEMRRGYDHQLDLFEKRQKNRQIDPLAPRTRIRSRPGPTVGEGTGFVGTFVGIMAVLCVGFGIMAWFSFQLPWFKKPAQQGDVAQGQPAQLVVMQPLVVQPPVAQPQQAPAAVAPEQQEPIKPVAEVPQAVPNAPNGTWVEKRPDAPGGDRIRTFENDGTFVIVSPKLQQRLIGTWRRDGSRVYFSHPAASPQEQPTVDKWFEIDRSDEQQMTIRMMGQREYVWQKAEPTKEDATAEDMKTTIVLLDEQLLDSWQPPKRSEDISNWYLSDGELTMKSAGPSLRTKQTFRDFDLHLEFKLPPKCNTGVFLRGRYEVQLVDSQVRKNDGKPFDPVHSSDANTG